MPDTSGSLMWRAALAACLTCSFVARAAAQQPVTSPPPPSAEFLSRYDFHLSAEALAINDVRFSWDTHFGGNMDLVDYVVGRASITADYEAVLGNEFRPFDPNQGNYTLEAAGSFRVPRAGTELVGMFHHVSRHLSDRPKRFAVAWNVLGARALQHVTVAGVTLDFDLEGGKIVQHAYVDYTWMGQLDALARRPLSSKISAFGHGSVQVFGVDGSVPDRGRQSGGLIEAGLRLDGKRGAIEVFAGFERRIDANQIDLQPQQWGLAGFRLLSR
jgi:hypothetical protein